MNETRKHTQSSEESVTRSVFWGTVALAGISLVVYAYFFIFLLQQPKTPATYIALVVFLSSFGSAIVSIVLTVRGRQHLGAKLAFYTLFVMGTTIIAAFQGRAQTASLSILTISIIEILYLLPKQSRRSYSAITTVAMIAMWAIEWINPPWRVEIAAARIGPAAVIIFAVILAVIFVRQTWGGSLRNKVLISAIGLTIISTGSLAFVNYYNTQSNLTKSSGAALKSVANSQALAIGNLLNQEVHVLQSVGLNKLIQDRVQRGNSSYVGDAAKIQAQIDSLDKEWHAADAANNNDNPLVYRVLNEVISSQLREFKDAFPENAEVFVTDKYGANIAATDRTSDYYQADEGWWQAAYNNGKGAVYFGEPEFDQSSKTFGLILAVPIYSHGTREVSGVIRTTINIDAIVTILSAKTLDGTGRTSLYLPGGQVLDPQNPDGVRPADSNATVRLPELISTKPFDTFTLDGVPSVVSAAQITFADAAMQAAITNLGWQVVVNQSQADNLAPIRQQTRSSTLVALVILAFSVMFALFLAQLLSSPIVRLTSVAEQIAAGNNAVQAKVETKDEIGKLAGTFNSMTAQLRELIGSLEQRVAERTHNLELAAEVGRAVSQVRDLNVMLKDACELILKEFDLYYVQVYLTNPSQTTLKLESGTGNVGAELIARGHSLPFDSHSINGRAAVSKHAVVIADAAQSATFRKNPLLPETHGEMAVPLIVADQVVGVLDMQSSKPGILTEEVLPAFEALAGQLAVAIQNANLLAETEEARAEVEKQARRLVRAGWTEHLDAVHQPEQIGFVFSNNQIASLDDKNEPQLPEHEKVVSAPISVTGEALGSLVVELDYEAQPEQTTKLVTIVARQVAQQIESLRILESAERYRQEAERVARRQTIEGWQEYLASRSMDHLGYMYDTNEVHAHENDQVENTFQFTLPLKARDETIGKLGVKGLNNTDQEAVELVNAVAERLSAHIESLRLFEETRISQVELDKRARQLAAVAEITTLSPREADSQKMLESVVHLTQRKFGLYHCHVFLYNEQTNILKIAACGWQAGDIHEGTHGTAEISLAQEQSLVARAARTQKAVIVNDVHNEPGWLPNPLLPDTAAELAVPLVVGGRLLGVLDVQSDHINTFTDEDANIQTTLASQVATALQNVYSFNQAQSALAQSEKLFDASRRLTQATDLQHLIAEAVGTMNIPEVNRALLATFDYDQNGDVEQLTIIGNWWNNTGHEITPVGTRYPREVIRVMSMFVSPIPVFFNDAFTDERVDATTMQLVKRLNLRAVAVLPLHLGNQQIGALILEAEESHNFTQDEIRLFSALAPQIATVVENRQQFEKAQRQAERESMLNAIGQKIQSATTVEAVLQIAARELGRALSAPLTVAQLGMSTKTAASNGN